MTALEQRIEAGLEGKYKGLSNGFKDVNKYIFGIQKSCYTLVGGESGCFKTTMLDFMVANAIEDAIGNSIPIEVFYYSFEIDKLTKQCNWLSRAIYNKYKIVIPPEKIKGLGDNRLTTEELEVVKSCIPDVEQLFDKIKFTFDPLNPTGINKQLFNHYESVGEILYKPYIDEHGKEKRSIVGYKPNNTNSYTLACIDHLALAKEEQGFNLKQNIDKISQYTIGLRNTFGLTAIYLQQFNDSLSSVERSKLKGVDLSPQRSDFKDTRNPYQDAEVVIGLLNPSAMDMESCMGYNVKMLNERMIMFKIIKNRLAASNLAKGLYVKPEAGVFLEMPKPSDLTINEFYNHKI
jgi:replicative DNA helicase